MELYAGLDLHSRNTYIGIMDNEFNRVFNKRVPKYRKKVLFGSLRKYLGDVFRKLALQKESKVLEGHLMGDHLHMLASKTRIYCRHQRFGVDDFVSESLPYNNGLIWTFNGASIYSSQLFPHNFFYLRRTATQGLEFGATNVTIDPWCIVEY